LIATILQSTIPSVKRPLSTCIAALAAVVAASHLLADIQEPPLMQYTATRKLARGLSNLTGSHMELLDVLLHSDEFEPYKLARGTSEFNAGWLSLFEGVRRTVVRLGMGFFETVTAPVTWPAATYKPQLRSTIPWVSTGYEEFPPTLGLQDRYDYSRTSSPHYRFP
jgi:hypothetical protein